MTGSFCFRRSRKYCRCRRTLDGIAGLTETSSNTTEVTSALPLKRDSISPVPPDRLQLDTVAEDP